MAKTPTPHRDPDPRWAVHGAAVYAIERAIADARPDQLAGLAQALKVLQVQAAEIVGVVDWDDVPRRPRRRLHQIRCGTEA